MPLSASSAMYSAQRSSFASPISDRKLPREDAAVMTVVEHQANRIIAHRQHLRDGHVGLAADSHPLRRRVPLHFRRRGANPQQLRLDRKGPIIGELDRQHATVGRDPQLLGPSRFMNAHRSLSSFSSHLWLI
jgi:hypothetical protein